MDSDPLQHPNVLIPENAHLLAQLEPLTLRTAFRFAKNLLAGVAFLGGIFLFLLLLLAAAAVVFAIWEEWSLGVAVYFVLTTALTIGFGDITPHTVLGRFLAPLVGLTGILMTGIFIAVAVRALEYTVREEIAHLRAAGAANPLSTK
jgi:voltage-gated potassium channel